MCVDKQTLQSKPMRPHAYAYVFIRPCTTIEKNITLKGLHWNSLANESAPHFCLTSVMHRLLYTHRTLVCGWVQPCVAIVRELDDICIFWPYKA